MADAHGIARDHSVRTVMEWRVNDRFPMYEISEYGDVRRLIDPSTRRSGVRLRGGMDMDGYIQYAIQNIAGEKVNVKAHVLVIEAFGKPRPSERHEVAHINGSRLANHYSNLKWKTRVENHADMQEHGTALKGERNGRAKITADDVRFIRREYIEIKAAGIKNRRVGELIERFGLHHATIVNIARGRAWGHVT